MGCEFWKIDSEYYLGSKGIIDIKICCGVDFVGFWFWCLVGVYIIYGRFLFYIVYVGVVSYF